MKARHHWTENDDLVAIYIYKHGTENLDISVEQIAEKLGMSTASMKMRIRNVKSADVKTGLLIVHSRHARFLIVSAGYLKVSFAPRSKRA